MRARNSRPDSANKTTTNQTTNESDKLLWRTIKEERWIARPRRLQPNRSLKHLLKLHSFQRHKCNSIFRFNHKTRQSSKHLVIIVWGQAGWMSGCIQSRHLKAINKRNKRMTYQQNQANEFDWIRSRTFCSRKLCHEPFPATKFPATEGSASNLYRHGLPLESKLNSSFSPSVESYPSQETQQNVDAHMGS